jgi:hypothetical protein
MYESFPHLLCAANRLRRTGCPEKRDVFTASFRSMGFVVRVESFRTFQTIWVTGDEDTGIFVFCRDGKVVLGSGLREAFRLHMAMISTVLDQVSAKGYRLY